MLDVEADLEMFKFMKQQYGWNFSNFTDNLFHSTRFFHDEEPRMQKFERYISSLITVYAASNSNLSLP
jgi:hypothetical protein